MGKERQNWINYSYLDMTIIKEQNKLTFNIYRKVTTTDFIIHNESRHLNKHKRSAINYLVNHINLYPLTQENENQELTIINEILKNNRYQQLPINLQHKNIAPSQESYTNSTKHTQKKGYIYIFWPRNQN
jgi:hypothetical protein